MDEDSKQKSFRRAFGAGAEAWKRKENEGLEESELSRAERDWNSEGNEGERREVGGEDGVLKKGILWGILCGALFVLGLVWMVLSQGQGPAERPEKEAQVPSSEVAPRLEAGGIVIGLVEEESERAHYAHIKKNLKELVEGFLSATSHEERLSYIVRPSEHGEAMKAFFEQKQRVHEKEYTVHTGNSVSSNGVQYTRMAVQFKNGSRRLAPVVNTQAGRFIDFEAYSRACSVPLEELLRNGGECEYARVFVEPVSYYNGVFGDDTRYRSYLITSPDLADAQIYGYVKHGDPTYYALEQFLKGGAKARFIVRLESLEESHRLKQFHIERVYCYGWVKAGLDMEVMIQRRIHEILRAAQ